MARAGKATVWKAIAPSGSTSSSGAAAAYSAVMASSGAPRAPASSFSTSARVPSCSLSSLSGAAPSSGLPLGLDELPGGSGEVSRPTSLCLGPPSPPLARTRDIEASALSASVTGTLGPAHAPSITVSPFRGMSTLPVTYGIDLPSFV
jgi:hypothetical protein